jgi:hypothetical protein
MHQANLLFTLPKIAKASVPSGRRLARISSILAHANQQNAFHKSKRTV